MTSIELRAELERYHRESYGWALHCCTWQADEAEGVLQAAYVKVLEGRALFDGKSSFKTWLFGVIRNTARDERRRRWVRQVLLLKHEPPQVARARPDEMFYQAELQTLLRTALAALPRRQSEVLQLVFYHELSLAEAAAVLGIALGSARAHYERGKQRLRQRLELRKVFDETGRRATAEVVPSTQTGR